MRPWNELSMAEKADVMKLAIEGGVYDLNAIRSGYNDYARGGRIHIAPSKRGTFTAAASKHGKSVQAFASQVLAHPENYSPAMRKKANFARNASKWKHELGGNLFSGEENHSQQMQLGPRYWADQTLYHDWQNSTIDGGTLPEVIVSPTNDASWLFSTGKYVHNPRKPLADKHTRKVVSGYLSKFDNESAKDYNERISRLADVLDIRGVQFKKNNVKSGKLKGRAHYIDNSSTAYIDSMEDIFAEVAHPWQYAKGNNNIEEEVGTGEYDSDSDPRGGTRYAYPDTAEGETHAFFEPVLTEWIETGKIGKSSPILNNELSRQKIKPKNRMEVGDSASSWNRQAIERRLLANPDQLPLHKRIQYGLFDYPLLDKKKNGFGGNLFDGTTEDSQQMKIGKPYYSYDENGRKIDDTLNYNISFPEIVITPDSRKSPAERAILERERRRNNDAFYGTGTYNAKADREQTELEKMASQKAWETSTEKQALDYAQAAATGIGIGADMVSGLPIYSSLKGARVLSEAETPMDYAEGALWLTPIGEMTYQATKPIIKGVSSKVASLASNAAPKITAENAAYRAAYPNIRYDMPSNDIIIESNASATPNIPFDEAWLAASKGRHQMSNLVGSDEYAARVRQAHQDYGVPVNQADFDVVQARQAIEDSDLKVIPNLKNANGDALNGQYDPETRQVLVPQDRDNILDIVGSSGHEHAHASEVDRLLGLLKEKWKHIKPRKEAFTRSDGSIDTEWKDYISKIVEMRAPAMSVWSEMKELGFNKVGDYLHHLKRFGLEDKQWEALVNRYGLTNAKYMVETVFGLGPFVINGINNEEEDSTTM